MKADFDKTARFAGSADLQVKAWQRFLAAWAQDNPLSSDDDNFRSQATARQRQAEAKPAPAHYAMLDAITPGEKIKDCAVCPELVVIPAGSFIMGSKNSESESPQHKVNIK